MVLLKRTTYLLVIIICLACGCKKRASIQEPQDNFSLKKANHEMSQQEAESLLKELKQVNPFRSDHATGASSGIEGNTELRGIIWDPKAPYALIGEFVVREGDTFDNKKVIKINRNSVILDSNGQRETLKIEGSF